MEGCKLIITNKLTMDLLAPGCPAVCSAVLDDRYTRQLEIALTLSGEAWPIPQDAAVLVTYSRPDGKGGQYDTLPSGECAWSVSGNLLTVILAPQVTAAAGAVNLWISLLRQEQQLSTFAVLLKVEGKAGEASADAPYVNISGFLPGTCGASPGQFLRITGIREDGYVTALEAMNLGDLALLHEPQTLTEEQKRQARTNIGAATIEEVIQSLPFWEGGDY